MVRWSFRNCCRIYAGSGCAAWCLHPFYRQALDVSNGCWAFELTTKGCKFSHLTCPMDAEHLSLLPRSAN